MVNKNKEKGKKENIPLSSSKTKNLPRYKEPKTIPLKKGTLQWQYIKIKFKGNVTKVTN